MDKLQTTIKKSISVSGVGASTARMMLSGMQPEEIIRAIVNGEARLLEQIKGIGKKSAERLVLELRDKLSKIPLNSHQLSGGVGFAKNAGNYAASMLATQKAKEAGYDQVLWTDAFEHKYLQEVGTMNVFFVTGNKVLTPALTEGTILEGVTRDSAITVLKEMGMELVGVFGDEKLSEYSALESSRMSLLARKI